MKNKLLMLIAVIGLSGTASAQLIVVPVPTSPLATALQSDPALLSYLTSNTASFNSGGFLFEQQANFALGDFLVSTTTEGAFFADVSFLGRDSLRPNHFGVTTDGTGYGAGGVSLWNDYVAPSDFVVSYRLSSVAEIAIDFWHYADKAGQQVTRFHNDADVRTWTAFDSESSMLHVFLGWDDQNGVPVGVDDNDYNDGAFLISFNLEPVAFENPVPEPSTYALWGAAMLLGVVAYRKRFAKNKPISAV